MSSPSDEGFSEEPVKPRPPREKDDDYRDERDDRPRRRRPPPRDGDDGGLGTLIPYRNGMALAAYYLGVFSLIPCLGLFLGPVAVVFGFLGLSHAKKHPEAKGTAHAIVGIVLGGLVLIAHLAVIGIGFYAAATNKGR